MHHPMQIKCENNSQSHIADALLSSDLYICSHQLILLTSADSPKSSSPAPSATTITPNFLACTRLGWCGTEIFTLFTVHHQLTKWTLSQVIKKKKKKNPLNILVTQSKSKIGAMFMYEPNETNQTAPAAAGGGHTIKIHSMVDTEFIPVEVWKAPIRAI